MPEPMPLAASAPLLPHASTASKGHHFRMRPHRHKQPASDSLVVNEKSKPPSVNKKRFSQNENRNALPFRRRLVRSFNKAFKGFVCNSDGPGSLLKTLRLSRKEATTVCSHVVEEVAVELAHKYAATSPTCSL